MTGAAKTEDIIETYSLGYATIKGKLELSGIGDSTSRLCDPRTAVLLSSERRPNDGFDAFVAAAQKKFKVDVVQAR